MSQDLHQSEALLDLAEQVIETQADRPGTSTLFERLIRAVGGTAGGGQVPDRVLAGALFDAFAARRRPVDRERLAVIFQPVAVPGALLGTRLQPGDLLVRRAIGEGGMGHVAVVVGPDLRPPQQALADGWRLEGSRPGRYVQVVEVGPHPRPRGDRFARRLLDPALRLPLDTLVLRLQAPLGQLAEAEQQQAAPRQQPPPAPDSPLADRFVAAHGSRWCAPGDANSGTCRRIPDPRPVRRVIVHTLAVPSTRRRSGAQAVVLGWQRQGRVSSAHYIIDRDGTTTQMVREADVAFHGGSPAVNADSIGIEHADVCNDPAPYTQQLYERSAALVRDIARRHRFSLVTYGADTTDVRQATVSGHVHHSGQGGHSDPGPYWDWQYYGLLLQWDGTTEATRPLRGAWTTTDRAVTSIPAGWEVQPRRTIANDRCASGSDPYGPSFVRASPDPAGGPVEFTLPITTPGQYRLSLWWPRVRGANPATPVQVQVAGGGSASAMVDQTRNVGRWVDVGGEHVVGSAPATVVVRLLRSSQQPGWIVADAVRLLRLRGAP
jgi:N-acetylmuramoyl-L-alanine amidase